MGLRIKPATLSDWWDKETTSNISFSNTTSFAEVTIIVKDKDWKTHQWRTACQEHKNSPRRPGNRKEWHHAGLLLHLCMTATCDWPAVAGLCVHTTSTVAPPQPRSAFSIECTVNKGHQKYKSSIVDERSDVWWVKRWSKMYTAFAKELTALICDTTALFVGV